MSRRIRNFKEPASFRSLLEGLDAGVYIQNSRGEIVDANVTFLRMMGAASLESLLLGPQDLLLQLQPLAKRLDLQKKERVTRRLQLPDRETGEPVTYVESCFADEDEEQGEVYYAGMLVRTEVEKNYAEGEKQNLRDPLTGVYNRHFLKVFEKENADQPWGCVLFMMDRIRRFSETFGEAAALEAICKMGRFLLRFVRVHDPVVRLDDEQYLLLICAEESVVQRVTRRLKNSATNQAPLSFSMAATFHRKDESLEDTIVRAARDLSPIKVMERIPRRHAG